MQIATLSLSHSMAPVSVREKCSLNGPALQEATTDLAAELKPITDECAVVSTCNRTEIYVAANDYQQAAGCAYQWLGKRFGVNNDDLTSHWRLVPDRQAVSHLFRVVSGLESMVLGEPQILGQVKGAARVAQDAGTLGSHLNKLFQHSFSVAKEVRTNTEVGHHSVSLGAAALRTARRVFEDLQDCSVLFVGAGEMIDLVATHFAGTQTASHGDCKPHHVRAQPLADKIGATVQSLDSIDGGLSEFDVVVTCTGSDQPVISYQAVHRALAQRKRRPIVFVDLAVPRDVEESVSQLDSAYLVTIDDLGRIVQSAQTRRRAAMDQAQVIIDARTDVYMRWLGDRKAVPAIKDLKRRANTLADRELERAIRDLKNGRDPEQVVGSLSSALSAKFIHGPMQMLRGDEQERDAIAQVIDRLLPKAG